jgi:transposase
MRQERAVFLKQESILYLPPYSPGLNPMETLWAKPKRILNKDGPRAKEALAGTSEAALGQISQADI